MIFWCFWLFTNSHWQICLSLILEIEVFLPSPKWEGVTKGSTSLWILNFQSQGGALCIIWILGTCHPELYRFSQVWCKDSLHFHDFGIRNGVNFYDLGDLAWNGLDFHDFVQGTVSLHFHHFYVLRMENRYKVRYTFLKNLYKVGYGFYAWAAHPL